jgi:hypothetical protein
MRTHHQSPTDAPVSTSGLLLALSHVLTYDTPLAQAARRLAQRLNREPSSRSLALEAAELLARLLDETDTESDLGETDVLDGGFDD